MTDLEDFKFVVSEFMNDFGGPATVEIVGDPIYNPVTGDSTASKTTYSVRAILLDLTLQSNGLTVKPGTTIQSGDRQAFIEPINSTDAELVFPKINPNRDKFIMNGDRYTILTAKQTNPSADQNILYELYLRL